jgi:biotin carboxyl carrier protein
VPPQFDSMIAKIIAHGSTRAEAIARLRRAIADTMVVIDDGATNQGFVLELLGRDELRSGDVDTGWLDRLHGQGEVQTMRFADVALVRAAIELCDDATAKERSRFYAFARRGRPEASAEVRRNVDLRYRGSGYRFAVSQVGPHRYLLEVDGTRIDAELEQVSEHEQLIRYGGGSYRTLTALQDADLLVEVDGVPHRISRDEGGLIRCPSPGVVVAIPVSPGDEVSAGDVLAVTESMKMESSLTAPVRGRVREVLVSTNTHVAAGRPLLQIEPLEDEQGPAEDDRMEFSDANADSDAHEPPLLDRLQWLVLGYDVPPGEAQRILDGVLAAPGDDDGELRLLEVYADLRAVSRPHAADDGAAADAPSPQHHLHAFLRSLDPSAEGLPDRFVASLERALRHYGIDGLERTAALEAASYRLFLARQRAATASGSVRGILERRLAETDEQLVCDDRFREVLDRLEAALAASEPGVAELAREVRWRLCDRPLIEQAREEDYAVVDEHLTALAEDPAGADREAHARALVDCAQPLAPLVFRRVADADPGLRQELLEAMTQRYYRVRDLERIKHRELDGIPFVLTSFEHAGVRHRGASVFAEPGELSDVLRALRACEPELSDGEVLLADVYAWRSDDHDTPADDDELAARLNEHLAAGRSSWPPRSATMLRAPTSSRSGATARANWSRTAASVVCIR